MNLDFKKALDVDVSSFIESKNGLNYLSWANAWQKFVEIYPTATYIIKKDDLGKCYFGDENIGYMVYTSVTVENLTHEMWLPVLDYNNNTMKTKPYSKKTKYKETTIDAISMFDINKTIMRCLTKNLAMFGLGLKVYTGEDLPTESKKDYKNKKETYTFDDIKKQIDSAKSVKQLNFLYYRMKEHNFSEDQNNELINLSSIKKEELK